MIGYLWNIGARYNLRPQALDSGGVNGPMPGLKSLTRTSHRYCEPRSVTRTKKYLSSRNLTGDNQRTYNMSEPDQSKK